MKKAILPFAIMPLLTPIYNIIDSVILVDIFGCGCVPDTQTNMLNIAFNANDLRVTVFFILGIVLSVWSAFISRTFQNRVVKILYCVAAVAFNLLLAVWVVKSFMWA